MSYHALRIGKLAFTWEGDVSTVLELTKRRVTFYGISWKWLAFGFYVIKKEEQ